MGVIALIVIAVVVVVIVLVVNGGGGGEEPVAARTPAPTPAPTRPPDTPASVQLNAILTLTENNTYAAERLDVLPSTVAGYEGQENNVEVASTVRAASWIMFSDPVDRNPSSPWFVVRYTLATLFYNFGGEGWTNRTGWLTGNSPCDWFGITCDRLRNHVQEIDLSRNNLVGTIPPEINFLSDLRALWLRENKLTGTLPALALGTLPSLTILYLEDNMLSGTISADLRANGVLCTLQRRRTVCVLCV
mmetsp:Transcript_9837/g.22711  ORF Transcript_9837/g.22711 Transcript_9837/m.22711 type:complete len:247 (-) Transcript_9837:1390-2130(-)